MLKKVLKWISLIVIIFVVIRLIMALVRTFIIMDTIKEIKKSADLSSAYGVIDAIEKHCALNSMGSKSLTTITDPSEVNFKGVKPTKINITLTEDCEAKGTFTYNDVTYEYDYTKEDPMTVK